jgi:two-component system sensor histidine kinase QseC
MRSLRLRLFVLLAATTMLVWSAAATWIYVGTRARVERVLDRRLIEAAGMVSSLVVASQQGNSRERMPIPRALQAAGPHYARSLSCQIWSLEGTLIGRSAGAPRAPLADAGEGFSEREIDGQRWRVYAHVDRPRAIRVLVGDNLSVRRNLVADLITGLLAPAIVALFALGLLIWGGLAKGLLPLRQMADALARRDHEDLSALDIHTSTELEPVARSVDALIGRLRDARERERHLIASAAHELQTPLAGLRTHAQIAARSGDDAVRARALERIVGSVDRTSRLVGQLLDLARQEAGDPPASRWLALGSAWRTVTDELRPLATRRGVELAADVLLSEFEIHIDEGALFLSLRNLVENAVNHAPPGSTVHILPIEHGLQTGIAVVDAGPGIKPSEIDTVRARFVRGSGETGPGSGLGLSIVDLTLARSGARLELENRTEGGLRAVIAVGESRLRRIRRTSRRAA